MNTSIAKKLFLVPAIFGLLALSTGCGSASTQTLSTYTGEATVKSQTTSKKICSANVETPDGRVGSIKIGTKTNCIGLSTGSKIKIENGKYKNKV